MIKRVNDANLTAIADAIRAKNETTGKLIFPNGFIEAIQSISTGANVSEALANSEGVFLTNNDFIKQHRNEDGFFAIVIPEVLPPTKFIQLDIGTNRSYSTSGGEYRSLTISASSESNTLAKPQTGAINGTPEGYNGCLITDSSGRLFCYTGGLQQVAAGNYHIVMGVLPI